MQLIDSISILRNAAEKQRKKPASKTYLHSSNTAALLFGELSVHIANAEKNLQYSDPIVFSVTALASQFIIEVNGNTYMSELTPTDEEPEETLLKLSTMFEEQLWTDYSTHLTNGNSKFVGRTRLCKAN